MSSPNYQGEAEQRARIALVSIHEARQVADNAVDSLIAELHDTGSESDHFNDAAQDAHAAVIMLYNRLRPYLVGVEPLWSQEPLYQEEEGDEGLYGLRSLDKWRLAHTVDERVVERVGKPDETHEEEQPLRLPPEVILRAYDVLTRAIVELGFGADVAGDVETTNLEADDEPDNSFGETPTEFENAEGE